MAGHQEAIRQLSAGRAGKGGTRLLGGWQQLCQGAGERVVAAVLCTCSSWRKESQLRFCLCPGNGSDIFANSPLVPEY